MAIPSKQIGWSNESNLLWQISKQLEQLTGVTSKISSGGNSYLSYVALLSQVGTDAPTAIVLQNDFDADITYLRNDTGTYAINSTEAIFVENKTWAVANTPSFLTNTGAVALQIGRQDDIECGLYCWDLDNNLVDLNTNGGQTSIEIRVYP